MRRILALALIAGSIAGTAPAAAADGYTPRRAKLGDATWLVPTSRPHVMIGYLIDVIVIRDLPQGKTFSFAVADKGTCHVKETKHSWQASCVGGPGDFVLGHPTDDQFQVDPALRTASVEFGRGSHRLRVDWTGNGPFGTGTMDYGMASSNGRSDEGTGLGEDAEATGHMFGDVVSSTHSHDWAFFGYGLDTPPLPAVEFRNGRTYFTLTVPR